MSYDQQYPMWTVVLASGNDERRYYVRTTSEEYARDKSFAEWSDEFEYRGARVVSITKEAS